MVRDGPADEYPEWGTHIVRNCIARSLWERYPWTPIAIQTACAEHGDPEDSVQYGQFNRGCWVYRIPHGSRRLLLCYGLNDWGVWEGYRAADESAHQDDCLWRVARGGQERAGRRGSEQPDENAVLLADFWQAGWLPRHWGCLHGQPGVRTAQRNHACLVCYLQSQAGP